MVIGRVNTDFRREGSSSSATGVVTIPATLLLLCDHVMVVCRPVAGLHGP